MEIKNYTIDVNNVSAYFSANADEAENIVSANLAKIDKNGDMVISENELVEFVETYEAEESEETTANSSTSSIYDAKISLLDTQCAALEAQINQKYAVLAYDTENRDKIEAEIESLNNELKQTRRSLRKAYYEKILQEEAEAAKSASGTGGKTVLGIKTGSGSQSSSSFANSIVSTAQSYVGKLKESDGSYKLVTNGRSEAWCADFVTYVVNQAQSDSNVSLAGFGSSSVSGLMAWGEATNRYGSITEMNSSEKANYIANNVKAGDIMIMKSNGASHTGIVTKVNADGSFETVEGNTSDQCLTRSYSADNARLSGFISMS